MAAKYYADVATEIDKKVDEDIGSEGLNLEFKSS